MATTKKTTKARRGPRVPGTRRPNEQEMKLAAKGYVRLAQAAERIGRTPFYLHREIRGGGLALGDDPGSSPAIRVGHLFYVRLDALAALVGPAGAKVLGLPPRC